MANQVEVSLARLVVFEWTGNGPGMDLDLKFTSLNNLLIIKFSISSSSSSCPS